jgi:TusA-related sulfurtransferase
MTTQFIDVDVRPTLRAGGEPFGEIMATIAQLQPGQGLRLLATFEPVPLFHVLGSKGFSHVAKEIGGGDWEVLFSPAATAAPADTASAKPASDTSAWPSPVQEMDNRDLDPPEPMVRVLAAVEAMANGEVLSALLCREPMFLLPELAKRGHAWRGAFEPDGKTYRILIRVGAAKEAA